MSRFPQPTLAPSRIAVLAGGTSAERVVSLDSGASVAQALRERGHQVDVIDPANVELTQVAWHKYDIAFLALHGPFGEDGEVQTLLDSLGVPYTGSDAEASQLAFSKSAAKERFVHHQVPTPASVVIHATDTASQIHQQVNSLGYPLVVKPDAQGSSLGISVVQTPDELPQALSNCFHYDQFGLVERAVLGTEWTLGVLDDHVFPLIQVTTPRGFYDYEAKYEADDTGYLFAFDISSELEGRIILAGQEACRALGTSGIARVDLRVDADGDPWVLEVNTIPGFTTHSLIPKAAAKVGLDLGPLCELAVESALERVSVREARRVG